MKNEWKSALAFMNKALKLNPYNIGAMTEKSNIYGYIGSHVKQNETKAYS